MNLFGRAVERDPSSLRDPLEAAIEPRVLSPAKVERVAPFGLLFHEHPVREPVRPLLQRVDPQIAVALVQEVSHPVPERGEIVDVVCERSHAEHDHLAAVDVVVLHQVGRDRESSGAVDVVALRLEDHRRAAIERRVVNEGAGDQQCRGKQPHASREQTDPRAAQRAGGEHQRHAVAHAQRMSVEVGVPWQRRRGREREHERQGRGRSRPDERREDEDGRGIRGPHQHPA